MCILPSKSESWTNFLLYIIECIDKNIFHMRSQLQILGFNWQHKICNRVIYM